MALKCLDFGEHYKMVGLEVFSVGKLDQEKIATNRAPNCFKCGIVGVLCYANLCDRFYGVPGGWNVKRCPRPDCGLAWLDPIPTREHIHKAYKNYYTHNAVEAVANGPIKQILKKLLLL